MRLVTQETAHTCGVACIAMIVNESFEHVLKMFPRDFEARFVFNGDPTFFGVLDCEAALMIHQHGIRCVEWRGKDLYKGTWVYDVYDHFYTLDEAAVRRLGQSETLMIATDSLNVPGGMHWVVAHEGKIFDPSNREKVYDNIMDIRIESAIICDIKGKPWR